MKCWPVFKQDPKFGAVCLIAAYLLQREIYSTIIQYLSKATVCNLVHQKSSFKINSYKVKEFDFPIRQETDKALKKALFGCICKIRYDDS